MMITIVMHALIMINTYLVTVLLVNSHCLGGVGRVEGVLVKVGLFIGGGLGGGEGVGHLRGLVMVWFVLGA